MTGTLRDRCHGLIAARPHGLQVNVDKKDACTMSKAICCERNDLHSISDGQSFFDVLAALLRQIPRRSTLTARTGALHCCIQRWPARLTPQIWRTSERTLQTTPGTHQTC